MRDNLVLFDLAALIIFIGLVFIRAGLVGQHLDHLRLVSNVKKSSGEPRWYHRFITIGIGVVFVLLGTGLFIFVIVSLSKLK